MINNDTNNIPDFESIDSYVQSTNELLQAYKQTSKENIKYQYFEILFWIIVSAVVMFFVFIQFNAEAYKAKIHGLSFDETPYYVNMVYATSPVFIPILFKFIFGFYPLQFFRSKLSSTYKDKINSIQKIQERLVETSDDLSLEEVFYTKLVDSSKKLSKVIFNRAGVYIFVGSVIAIGGLLYFTSTFQINSVATPTPNDLLKVFLPRFGALFFLEFIAFFFLKQYKFTMDEFRYYEGIQRTREEKLFFIKAMKSDDQKEVLIDILRNVDSSDKILSGNSSLILESKKLHKDEFEILNKIVDKVNIGN
jgi:TRAP-type C4-dicarboxylate transport system permease small subunit